MSGGFGGCVRQHESRQRPHVRSAGARERTSTFSQWFGPSRGLQGVPRAQGGCLRNCASRSAVSSADRCRATSDNTANAKCFAAIRAIATVVADTQEESRSKVCVENGPEEDYEKEYSVVVEVASALAVAKEFANACEDDELRSSSESYREAPCLRGKCSLTRGAACVVANEACTVSLPLSLPAWQVRLALWRCLCRCMCRCLCCCLCRCLCRYLCGEAARLACMA